MRGFEGVDGGEAGGYVGGREEGGEDEGDGGGEGGGDGGVDCCVGDGVADYGLGVWGRLALEVEGGACLEG